MIPFGIAIPSSLMYPSSTQRPSQPRPVEEAEQEATVTERTHLQVETTQCHGRLVSRKGWGTPSRNEHEDDGEVPKCRGRRDAYYPFETKLRKRF